MNPKPKRNPTEPVNCKRCGAPMLWVKFHSGKSAPIDAEPIENGLLCVTFDKANNQLKAKRYDSSFDGGNRNLYDFHSKTCGAEAGVAETDGSESEEVPF